tara:strand:+ start:3027 stop:3401 length:375 start_codon:yes stop_codon:yes gene_type:complete
MAALIGSAVQLASPAAQALSVARMIRSRAPPASNKGEHLGKTLTHHQVVPADQQPRTANNPRTDFGKAVMSGTGGNPRAVNQAIDGIRSKATSQISPFHRRRRMADDFANSLKHTPHSKNFNST